MDSGGLHAMMNKSLKEKLSGCQQEACNLKLSIDTKQGGQYLL